MYTTSPNFSNRNYIFVDHDQQIIGFTPDSQLASSPKQISKFYSLYSNSLRQHHLQHLACTKLEQPTIEKIEKSHLPTFLKKIFIRIVSIISAIFSFIKNGGKTDARLVNDIGHQTAKQYVNGFYHMLSRDTRKSLRNLQLNEEIKLMIEASSGKVDINQLTIDDYRELYRINNELKVCKDEINKIKKELQYDNIKEELRQALAVLEPENPSEHLQAAIQEFKTANEKFIVLIKALLEPMETLSTPSTSEDSTPIDSFPSIAEVVLQTDILSPTVNSIIDDNQHNAIQDETHTEILNIPEDASAEDLKALISRNPQDSDYIISKALENRFKSFISLKSELIDMHAICQLQGKALNLFMNLAKLFRKLDFEAEYFRFLNTLEELLISTNDIKKMYLKERNEMVHHVLKLLCPQKIKVCMETFLDFLQSYQIENNIDPYTEFLRKAYDGPLKL